MNKEYSNENRGVMYRNDRKEQDNHPDFKGSLNVDGVEYWLSGWTKEGKEGSKMEGRKFFSLSIKPKEEQQKPAAKPAQKARQVDMAEDDIPFADPIKGRSAYTI